MDDKITVIVPVYNIEEYLERCIKSILSQSYSNIEILLVDDGSTDASLSICKKYEILDDRVTVISQKNRGLSAARNTGINHMTGTYAAFIDGDDYIDSNYIEILYESLCRTYSDVAICGFVEEYPKDRFAIKSLETESNVIGGRELLLRVLLKDGYRYVVAWNKLYKASLFRELQFAEGRIHEDELISYRLFWNCKSISLVDDCLYHYIKRDNSIMSETNLLNRIKAKEYMHVDRIQFYKNLDEELYQRSCQQYLNWLLRTISNHEKLLDEQQLEDYLNCINNVLNEINNRYTSMGEKIQNSFVKADYRIVIILRRLLMPRR